MEDGVAIIAARCEGPQWSLRWHLSSGEQHWSPAVSVAASQNNPILIAIGTQLPGKPIITGGDLLSEHLFDRAVDAFQTIEAFVRSVA